MDVFDALMGLIWIVEFFLVPVGLVLGVVAFFRARRLSDDVARLRRELAALRAAQTEPPPASVPPVMPWAPEPAAEAGTEVGPERVPERVPEPGFAPEASPVAEPPVEAATEPARPPARPADMEEVLALKWGVWLGAVALLFAGVFLVRYAVEHGVLGPAGRCILAAVLGAALIGGAEWLRRQGDSGLARVPWPDQAPPALASGGVAVLFGAAYGFGPYYDLLPASLAFLLMAAVGFVGLALSLRFGQLVAAVGLAGAYATPLLVTTEHPSIPGLYVYLLVVTAAALAVVRYAAWVWLDWASLAASTAWVVVGMAVDPADAWVPGLFVPAVALVNLALLPRAALDFPIGRQLVWVPFAALGVVGLMLYLAHPGWGTRMGVLLLAPLAIGKGAMEPRLDRLPWLSALFFLLVLLGWALPYWRPTGEIIGTQEFVQAILPGGWAPEVIQPLLITAACMTALYVAAGLWRERVAEQPLAWSALAAAVPTLARGVTYTMVERFQARPLWALMAALLAAGQTLAVEAARRSGRSSGRPFALQRAGVHAAGAVASLALGLSMVLADQWLTVTVALLLPALAWIAERAELPGLRRVALAVAGLVLIRLLVNWYVFDYALGSWPIVNGLLVTYGLPALCFAYASILFRRRGDDLLVAVLESGAVAFLTILVALEIRHWASGGNFVGGRVSGVLEAGLHVSSMAILALMSLRGAERLGRKVLDMAWRIQGGLALFGGFLLLLLNPLWGGVRIDGPIVFNPLLFAYLLPAGLAGLGLAHDRVRRRAGLARWLGFYALLAVFAWITLEIRHDFHPGRMGLYVRPVTDAELWSWSAAWLAYGIALMGAGIHWRLRPLRLAALTVVGLTAGKVFLIDMSGLTGLWRAVSFLGLGLTLIGLGAAFRHFVGGAERQEPS